VRAGGPRQRTYRTSTPPSPIAPTKTSTPRMSPGLPLSIVTPVRASASLFRTHRRQAKGGDIPPIADGAELAMATAESRPRMICSTHRDWPVVSKGAMIAMRDQRRGDSRLKRRMWGRHPTRVARLCTGESHVLAPQVACVHARCFRRACMHEPEKGSGWLGRDLRHSRKHMPQTAWLNGDHGRRGAVIRLTKPEFGVERVS